MKKLTVTTLLITICLSTNAMAKNNVYNDSARVTHTAKTFEQAANRVPDQGPGHGDHRALHERQRKPSAPSVIGVLLGGVIVHTLEVLVRH